MTDVHDNFKGIDALDNRKLFNEFSAKLFAELYENFPIGTDFKTEDFPELNTIENNEIFFSTIRFYINEGFIRCEKQIYGGFVDIVLTSKGFSILNAKPPENFSLKSNIGAELKTAVAAGKTTVVSTLVSEIIKIATRLIIS